VPRFLESGRYEPRAARATISNAMDVGDPSNFQRMLWLFGGEIDRMRKQVHGSRHTDEETRRTIRRIHSERGYLLDPHTAVGYLGLRNRVDSLGNHGSGIVLATAHPAKFKQEIEGILGVEVELPERLARCLGQRSTSVFIPPTLEALADVLRHP
jgi:threonine synthase